MKFVLWNNALIPSIAELPNANINAANFPDGEGAVSTKMIPTGIEMKKIAVKQPPKFWPIDGPVSYGLKRVWNFRFH